LKRIDTTTYGVSKERAALQKLVAAQTDKDAIQAAHSTIATLAQNSNELIDLDIAARLAALEARPVSPFP
jgi:hypothetical protein